MDELLARIEALGRRGGKLEASRLLACGSVVMDLDRHRVVGAVIA